VTTITGVLSAPRIPQTAPPTRVIYIYTCYNIAALAGRAHTVLSPGEYIRNYTSKVHYSHSVAYFGVYLQILWKLRIIHWKTKSSGIMHTPWAVFVPISADVLSVVSAVLHGKECALFRVFSLQILLQLKNFCQKSKCMHHHRTRCHVCAKFDVRRPSQSSDIAQRKTSHTPTLTTT